MKEGQLLTPIAQGEEAENALPAPVLPGITRAAVIELAEELGVTVKKQMLGIDDLLEADEVFLTNSSWQILPVSRIEKSAVGPGKAGDLTGRLRDGFKQVGYIQLADHPGRAQPGTGEIRYERVLQQVYELGYRGYVGLECWPKGGEDNAAQDVRKADRW